MLLGGIISPSVGKLDKLKRLKGPYHFNEQKMCSEQELRAMYVVPSTMSFSVLSFLNFFSQTPENVAIFSLCSVLSLLSLVWFTLPTYALAVNLHVSCILKCRDLSSNLLRGTIPTSIGSLTHLSSHMLHPGRPVEVTRRTG
jgi:hypothetical protein